MIRDSSRKRLPPYISYRTFQNFIDRLQQGIPSRIDRSFWGDRLSGSSGVQLMSSLRFLNLIDAGGTPTGRLRQLVNSKGAQRKDYLHSVATESYGFLFSDSVDLQSSTYSQIEEAFQRTFELTDSVNRKCVKFFVSMTVDAGVPLSPFITRRLRSLPDGTGTKLAVKRKGLKSKTDVVIPQEPVEIPVKTSWDRLLLSKFPTFNPEWSDEVKLGWLEAFSELKFPVFDPAWSDEVKLKWFDDFDKLLKRNSIRKSS